MQGKDLIESGFGLGAFALKQQKPKVSGGMPTIEDLEDRLNQINNQPATIRTQTEVPISSIEMPALPSDETTKGTACIPCSLSHAATCTGELNEAVRFAREDIANPEVTIRVDHCLSEIAACERIDLAPENTVNLPPQEKELADSLATELRYIRHGLEWFKSKEDLEKLAAQTAELQHDISRKWLNIRLNNMTEADKDRIMARAQELFYKE